jgi:hypothetical protein
MTAGTFKVGLLILPLAAALGAAPGQVTTGTQREWNEYRLLVERNVFRRDRGRRQERQGPRTVPAPPRPERSIVLTGIAVQGDQRVAFLEDRRTGVTTRAVPGQKVASGAVTEVQGDRIKYEADGTALEVRIGQNLESGLGTGAPAASATAAGEGAPEGAAPETTTPAGAAGGARSDLLERLRQQRLRELGR